MQRGALMLEDGSKYNGFVFGASTNATGEVGKILFIDLFSFLCIFISI